MASFDHIKARLASGKAAVDGSTESGTFMSGNILSKGIDLLSLPNYAAAGAADALLSGKNPIAGAGEGIHNRQSFIDTFEHHGAPKWAAIPGGLVADFLIPDVAAVPLALMNKGGKAAKIVSDISKVSHEERPLANVIDDTINAVDQRFPKPKPEDFRTPEEADAAADLLDASRARAPRDQGSLRRVLAAGAARTAHVTEGVSGARAAAWKASEGAADARISPLEAARRKLLGKDGPRVALGFQQMFDDFILPLREALYTNPLTAPIAKVADAAMERFSQTKRATASWLHSATSPLRRMKLTDEEGAALILLRRNDNTETGLKAIRNGITETELAIAKALRDGDKSGAFIASLRKDLADLKKLLPRGERIHALTSSQRVLKASELAAPIFDEAFKAASKLGVEQVQSTETALWRTLHPDVKAAIIHGLKTPGGTITLDPALPEGVAKRARALVLHLKERGYSIREDADDIVSALQYTKNYFPAPKKLFNTEAGARELTANADAIHDLAHKIGMPIDKGQAQAAAAAFLRRDTNVAKQFQHSRVLKNHFGLENIHEFDTNINRLLDRYTEDISTTLSRAAAWGGDDAILHNARQTIKAMSDEAHVDENLLGQATKAALTRLDKAVRMQMGQDLTPADKVISTLGKLTNQLMLGPRTILLQFTNFAHINATTGYNNAHAALWAAADPKTFAKVSQILDLAGAPSMWDHVTQAPGVLDKALALNPIMRGITAADHAGRVTAALSGAMHADDLAEALVRARQAGDSAQMGRLMNALSDMGIVLAEDGKLTSQQMQQAMRWAADKTQFSSDLTKLPYAYNTTPGRFLLKFRQFSYHQFNFTWDLLQQAKRGNPAPLLRYAALMPSIYHKVLQAANQLRPEEKQTDPHNEGMRYAQDLLLLGGLGYVGDTAAALGSSSDALALGLVAGPNTGALIKAKKAVWNQGIVEHDPAKGAWTLAPQTIRQGANLWKNLDLP